VSAIDEQDLINRLTRRARIKLAASIVGATVITVLSHLESLRGWAPAEGGAIRSDVSTWLTVAIAAVFLPLYFFMPRWYVDWQRRRIVAGTWALLEPSDEGPDPLRGHAALQSDRGKLAFVWYGQIECETWCIVVPAFVVANLYLATKNPFELGVLVLLACGLVARFPRCTLATRSIDRQQEVLIQERQLTVSKPRVARIRKQLQKPRNLLPRDEGSIALEDEVCSWLIEGAGANDLVAHGNAPKRRDSPPA
jgi:hypothetical protein